MKRILLILFVLFPCLVFAQGGERILSYDSHIKINPAGDMTVTDTIKVVSEGDRIKHGITRDFSIKGHYTNMASVPFELLAVLKNGKPEPWRSELVDDGVRVNIGSKKAILKPGEYTYTITYRADPALGFLEKHDELFRSVTGDKWEFPIEKVNATVELPPGVELLSTEAWASGSEKGAVTAGRDNLGRAVFSTTRTLEPYEGVTILAMWPKGFVHEPAADGGERILGNDSNIQAHPAGEERILSHDSFIKINPAGDVTVTETIRVVCGGDRAKYGVYRDFPTHHKDKYNNTVRVNYDFESVLKNGVLDDFETGYSFDSERVYLGRRTRYSGSGKRRRSYQLPLEPGEYSFVLTYRIDRPLGFFEKHDELFWNVTGNEREVPIEKASATVELPPGAEILATEAYTGLPDEKGADFTVSRDKHGRAVFSTTRPLKPGEGLTIAAMWPKGLVHEPTEVEKTKAFLKNNGSAVAGVAGIVVLLLYYLLAWIKTGKEPEKGVIATLYEAPEGFSPAAVRYVMRMGFDDKAFAATLVNMAVKGYLSIDKDTNGDYTLTRKGEDFSGLSKGEMEIAGRFFSNETSFVINDSNRRTIKLAIKGLQQRLAKEYEKIYFLTIKSILVPGLVISAIFAITMAILGRNIAVTGFLCIFIAGWTLGCTGLLWASFQKWIAAIKGQINFAQPLGVTMFTLPFLAGEFFIFYAFADATSIPAALGLFIIVTINIAFYAFFHLMKTPTIKGRSVMDQIEGLKLYLSGAAESRFRVMNSPEKTPEIFEQLLPYAVALDVEQEWCEQFADVLTQAGGKNGYTPGWSAGNHFAAGGVAGLVSILEEMISSISLSAPAKGSSSG